MIMRANYKQVLSFVAFAATTALTGCGGGGSDSPSTAVTVTTTASSTSTTLSSTSTTFTVRDTAGVAMLGATVYAIPATDVAAIAKQPITLSMTDGLYTADAQKVDEPLEDLINGNFTPTGGGVATYKSAVADSAGKAVIANLPASAAYFIYVKPTGTDTGHLPGGSLTRTALAGSALVSKDTAVKVSTMPSSAATYIGSSLCIACHKGKAGVKQTLHKLGIMVPKSPSGLQDLTQFSSTTNVDQDFNAGLKKFEGAGTTLYYYGYSGGASGSFKVLPTNPTATQIGSGQPVYFTLGLSKTAAGVYQVTFNNLITPTDPLNGVVRKVDLTYGGGLHKQRYMTRIGSSIYILPLQFQPQGSDSSTESRRFQWIEYDTTSKKWWNGTTSMFIDPNTDATGRNKSFDIFCAGCHYTGLSVTKNSDNSFSASAAADYKGEMHPVTGKTQELNVGCESCHGPGSEHMDAGGLGKFIITPMNLTPEREVQICAQCHTRTNSSDKVLKLENPLDKNYKMMLPGTSRADFLANNVSAYDTTAFWGDSKHAKKHHSQATEFIQTKKYRNGTMLMTCASCHDVHAPGTDRHQMSGTSDNKLCLSCHTTKTDLKTHMDVTTGYNMGTGTLCIQCHLQKTAQSGSGSPATTFKSPSGQEYFHNDISSHMFDVPLKTSISATNKMPVAFTNACGVCHNPVRLP